MILRTQIGGRALWLIEEPVPVRGHRRVLLAVDTSDSCWPAHRAGIEAALRSVSNGIQAHDECCLWVVGCPQPVLTTFLAEDTEAARTSLCRTLLHGLRPELGGTWLRETAGAMVASAASDGEAVNYLLVITDGEAIFDAEAVPAPAATAAAAVHHIVRRSRSRLGDDASGVPAWPLAPANLPGWFGLDRGDAQLEVDGGCATAYRFTEDGQVDPSPVAWPQPVVGSYARYAFLTEALPRLRVVTSRGARAWHEALASDAGRTTSLDALSPSLRNVVKRVWGLQLDWRADVLTLLRGAADADIQCPNCGTAHSATDVRAGRSAYCSVCRALVLVHGFARRDDPALAGACVLLVPPSAPFRLLDRLGENGEQEGLVLLLERGSF